MTDEASNTTQDDSEAAGSRSMSRKLQLVRVGASQFGVFADEIATIVAWRNPTPLPLAPKPVLGVVSVQGRILTVLDLALLTGEVAQNESDTFHGNLVALRGDEQLALAVSDVGECIELLDGFAAQPENGKLVLGVLQRDTSHIKILNLKELFPTAIQGRERRRRRF
jgi:chemotaxis signal transduction protein